MTDKILLGLSGRKGSGKSAATTLLVNEYGAVRSSFANPLKEMLRTMGLSEAQLYGDQKEVPDHKILFGRTPRHAMQTLGTEWGRNSIHPDIWANLWRVMEEAYRPTFTVVEDVRFDNEIRAIESLGGIVVGIERGMPSRTMYWKERLGIVHASENFSKLVRENDLPTVKNDSTLEVLVERIMEQVRIFQAVTEERNRSD